MAGSAAAAITADRFCLNNEGMFNVSVSHFYFGPPLFMLCQSLNSNGR
jgi:hypothetical protein